MNEKGLKVTNGNNVGVNIIPHPVYENVTAIKTTSLDTSPAQSQIGEITVYINHFGKEKQSDKKFIVYYEARKCAKDYKK